MVRSRRRLGIRNDSDYVNGEEAGHLTDRWLGGLVEGSLD